jgi:hypothetical protein
MNKTAANILQILFYVFLNADMLLADLVPKSTSFNALPLTCLLILDTSVISGLKFWDLDV